MDDDFLPDYPRAQYDDSHVVVENEYPDPEDVSAIRYPWVGNLDDAIPAALQERVDDIVDEPEVRNLSVYPESEEEEGPPEPSLLRDETAVDPDYSHDEIEEE